MKKTVISAFCLFAIVALYFSYAFISYHSYSEKETVIDLPEDLKYDFSEFDLTKFEKYEVIHTKHTDVSGDCFMTVREYYSNKNTGERLTRITRQSDGGFLKGYYSSPYCSCVFYEGSVMKLIGGKMGKVYCFENSKLKYISEVRTCKRLFSSVYVITYYDGNARRIAVETRTASLNGNVKAVKFLYNRHYNRVFLPISEKRFKTKYCVDDCFH